MKEQKEAKFGVVEIQTLNAILQYLGNRPFVEVSQIIEALKNVKLIADLEEKIAQQQPE